MVVGIKKLNENATLPSRGSDMAAGYDLYAACEGKVIIKAHETKMIGTGLCLEIPEGYFGGIFARSGLASKRSLRPANCVGVIDADYRGEIIVALHNDSDTDKEIDIKERIAQLIIMPCPEVDFEIKEEVSSTERGEGGFGSTGSVG